MTMTPVAGQRKSLKDLKVGRNAQPQWPDKVKFADMADNPDNPRDALRDLEGLAATIKESGILQDLVLVPRESWLTAHPGHDKPIEDGGIGDKPFVILIGHRRRHAGELAGLDEAPVKVREDMAGASRRNALIENVQRDDLSPLEEAHAIRDLMAEENLSQGKAAALLGKSGAWVSFRLALLGLRPELQQALIKGDLKLEDARRIGRLPHGQQIWPEPDPEPDLGLPPPATAPKTEPLSQPESEPAPAPGSPTAYPKPERPAPASSGGEGATPPSPGPQPVPPENAGSLTALGRGEPPQEEISLNEALRLEGAANMVSDQRALRQVAHRHPKKAHAILKILEDAVATLRKGLTDDM
ncbi:ParB/RepB/Spo0J family partition protein [Nonomuraea sp. NPDC026600]|uniref:ParB/RepB/Spo0J family partition protein n=1 Tax=Nonomuraea sp. NPDC026600 TaxID=3155363 RepID=UPI0033C8968A